MQADHASDITRVVISSNPMAVREALCALFDRLMMGQVEEDTRDTAQLVLAEALNNIVEHAYAAAPGEIEVTLEVSATGLTCNIVDQGSPMPGGTLPAGHLPEARHGAVLLEDLPEGGFGWHLIRTLSQDLTYRRVGSENMLSFRVEAKQSPQ